MKCFSGIMRVLHNKNKTPKPAKPVRFEVKLSELERFVKSHAPEAEDSHAPEAKDSQAPKAKDSPQVSAEDMRKLQVKDDLNNMKKNGAEISLLDKKRVIVRFEEVGKNGYTTLGLIRPDFWPSRKMNLRQGGFICSLNMEAVKELEKDIDEWKRSRKS